VLSKEESLDEDKNQIEEPNQKSASEESPYMNPDTNE
jgi:hypothetical protein